MVFRASSRGLEAGRAAVAAAVVVIVWGVALVDDGSRSMTGMGAPTLTGAVVAADSGAASRLLRVVVELKADVWVEGSEVGVAAGFSSAGSSRDF